MSENERFKETYRGGYDFVDTLTRKPYSYCECINLLNQIWEQTQRFEKHNQRLVEENEHLKKSIQQYVALGDELIDDVEYWKQVASQKENELNVLQHQIHKKR